MMKKYYLYFVSIIVSLFLSVSAMASPMTDINLETGPYLIPPDTPDLATTHAVETAPIMYLRLEYKDFDVGRTILPDIEYRLALMPIKAVMLYVEDYETRLLTYKASWRN